MLCLIPEHILGLEALGVYWFCFNSLAALGFYCVDYLTPTRSSKRLRVNGSFRFWCFLNSLIQNPFEVGQVWYSCLPLANCLFGASYKIAFETKPLICRDNGKWVGSKSFCCLITCIQREVSPPKDQSGQPQFIFYSSEEWRGWKERNAANRRKKRKVSIRKRNRGRPLLPHTHKSFSNGICQMCIHI